MSGRAADDAAPVPDGPDPAVLTPAEPIAGEVPNTPVPDAAVLRDATAADVPAIMALEQASFPTDAWSPQVMAREVISSLGRYVVLEVDGAVQGYAGLRAPAGSRDADIQTIAVAAEYRGRGWGRMLVRELLAEAARRHVTEVFLEVRADNPTAQGLYASEGFTELGRRPHYYQPDDVEAIVMRARVRKRAASVPAAAVPASPAASAMPDAPAASAASTQGDVR